MKPASKFLIIALTLSSTIAAASILYAGAQTRLSEDQARRELNVIYKGDYRTAFREKKPGLFPKTHL